MKTVRLSPEQQIDMTIELNMKLDNLDGDNAHALHGLYRQLTGDNHAGYVNRHRDHLQETQGGLLQFKQPDVQLDGTLPLRVDETAAEALTIHLNLSLRDLQGPTADRMNGVFAALTGRSHDVHAMRRAHSGRLQMHLPNN